MKLPLLPYTPAVHTSAPGYLRMKMQQYREALAQQKQAKRKK